MQVFERDQTADGAGDRQELVEPSTLRRRTGSDDAEEMLRPVQLLDDDLPVAFGHRARLREIAENFTKTLIPP